MKHALVAVISALSLIMCVAAPTAFAHGLGYTMLDNKGVVSFEAMFSTGDPVSYAEVFVYAPDAKTVDSELIEYQNGRTDAAGRFAFIPDSDGKWNVVVSAGMGHRLTFDVEVGADSTEKNDETHHASRSSLFSNSPYLPLVAGLSIILNLFLALRLRNKS